MALISWFSVNDHIYSVGKMIFSNLSIVTALILALMKLLRVLWCPKHRRLSYRKFLRWKYLKNKGDSSFQKSAEKWYCHHGNTHEGLFVDLNFSELKIPRNKSHKAVPTNS